MDGRLNLFQRMMLRWRDLHPYNPVHVVRIPSALDPVRLRACIGEQLGALGLTGLAVDREHWRYRYAGGGAEVDLTVAAAGTDPLAVLSRTIEHEFNAPFPPEGRANPFRFFAIEEGDAFHLALAYDHFVAGGDSIARLLTGIACTYSGHAGGTGAPAPDLYPATYRSVFFRHPLWSIGAILALPGMIASSRRAHRPRYSNVEDERNAFTYLRLGPPQTRALVGAGKAWGVTLNDLLMAILLHALSPLAAERRRARRRTELGVASIMNIRQDFQAGASDAVSPFLAAFRVGHPVPDGIGLRQLVQDVHAATARIKRGHLYLQSILALGVSALLWPFLSARQRHRFYPKYYPAWAGVTTLNVNPIWDRAGCAGTAGLDYLRAVPTGPLCPLVFAVTTVRDVLHVGVSFRTAAFSRAAVEGVTAEFVRCVDGLQPEPAQ